MSYITPDLFSAGTYRTVQMCIFYIFAQPDLGKCYDHVIKMKLHSVYNNIGLEFILVIQIHHVYTAESGMIKTKSSYI